MLEDMKPHPTRQYCRLSYRTFVEAHIAESAHRQKVHYDRHSEERHFKAGDLV